jgi:hypothetical protein
VAVQDARPALRKCPGSLEDRGSYGIILYGKERKITMSTKTELIESRPTFEYAVLPPEVAEDLRCVARNIRRRVKRAVADIVEIGLDLLAVKDRLPHGQFTPWLQTEFGWSERQARNFMNVADWLRPKTAILADLPIQPTAAYLLAAPSVPDEARQEAVERAEAGEEINTAVAREIVADARKARKRSPDADRLSAQLDRALERYLVRWPDEKLPELARQLREFADEVTSE